MARRLHPDGGYTLFEVLLVLLILTILVAIAVASYFMSTGRATEATCDSNRRTLRSAAITYASGHDSEFPATLEELEPYVNTRPSEFGLCPTDGTTEYDYDPVLGVVTCSIHP